MPFCAKLLMRRSLSNTVGGAFCFRFATFAGKMREAVEHCLMQMQAISGQLNFPSGPLAQALRETAQAIDRVHRVPLAEPLPIVLSSRRFGGYVPQTDDGPRRIELSPDGPHPRLTLAHEIGHYLDDLLGDFIVYASMEPDSQFAGVLAAAGQSRALTAMRDYLTGSPSASAVVRFQLRNWLEPPEIWARAYAQHIVIRSGDAVLRTELNTAIHLGGPPIYQSVQWSDEDFKPISAVIDALLRRLAWR